MSECDEAVRCDSKNSAAYCSARHGIAAKGENDKAIADCTQAIRLDPKDAKAYGVRGTAYENMGKHDKAIEDYSRVIQLEPKHLAVYFAQASIYEEIGDTRKAEDDFAMVRQLRLSAVLEKRGLAKTPVSKVAIESVEKSIHKEVAHLGTPMLWPENWRPWSATGSSPCCNRT